MDCCEKIKELRKSTGMNRRVFCEYFQLPYRTVTEWERDTRHAPEYVLRLLEYYIRMEFIEKQKVEEVTAEAKESDGCAFAEDELPNVEFIDDDARRFAEDDDADFLGEDAFMAEDDADMLFADDMDDLTVDDTAFTDVEELEFVDDEDLEFTEEELEEEEA